MNTARFNTGDFLLAMQKITGGELKESESLCKVLDWMKNGKNSLVLMGGIGTGKTTIALALCHCWSEFATTATIQGCDLLADRIKADESLKFEIAFHKGLLVLDDLGTEEKVYNSETMPFIIYRRYERNLPTIITTNYNTQKIQDRYGERIADRLKTWDKLVLNYDSLR